MGTVSLQWVQMTLTAAEFLQVETNHNPHPVVYLVLEIM